MLIWGVHVHVGVSSAHKVMPIISSLLNHYPHLLALSSSSPYWEGDDTGYASNRAMMFQQLPTAGLPFQFQTWREFERFVHDQKKTGIIDHINEVRWDIRPSRTWERWRSASATGVEPAGAFGAGGADALSDRRSGPPSRSRRGFAGHAAVACSGKQVGVQRDTDLDAIVILDADSNERLVTEDLDDLLTRLQPVAESLPLRRGIGRRRRNPQTRGVLSASAPGREGARIRPSAVVDSMICELDI